MNTFFNKLQQATDEDKQVNPIYVQEIHKNLPKISNNTSRIDIETIVYPEIKTDGIYRCYYINDEDGLEYNYLLQIECKLDVDFRDTSERAKVLLQVCCYLKQIHDRVLKGGTNKSYWDSNGIPKVIVLGSKINCLVLPSKYLIQFASGYIADYTKASTAYSNTENSGILHSLKNNHDIQTYSIVYDAENNDTIQRICEGIIKLGKDLKITDDLTEHTISLAFDFFDMYVLDKKNSSKLTSREKVDLFIGTFYNEEFEEAKTNRYSNSPDKLKIHGIEIKVNPDKYNQFKLLYNMREYSKLEQKNITAITDRLIEDTDRRRKGDFYTPSIWVDEAHKLIDKNLGDNWRDEYMVWDCAWGTGNLTRDYRFADLYCSTLQQEDLNIGYRYNKGAVKFQYDFLNDDVEDMERIEQAYKLGQPDTAKAILFNTKLYKQAPGLIDGLLGLNGKPKKKLLFLINPPYAGVGNMGNASLKENKSNSTNTLISDLMKENNIKGTNNLYMQFMYRINYISRLFGASCNLALFCPADIMNNPTGKDIRKLLNTDGGLTDGFVFKASHFADVSDTWGIAFSLWTNKKNEQNLQVKDIGERGDVVDVGYKKMQEVPADGELLKRIKTKIKCETEEIFRVTSGINIDTNHSYIRPIKSMGSCMMDTANVSSNQQRVNMVNTRTNGNWSIIDILEDNIMDVMAAFSARRMIKSDWLNYQDKYMYPDKSNDKYSQYEADALIYCLFESKMQISSLRNISYNGKQWNIQNEFFWMSVKEIEELAGGKYSADDINTVIEDDIEDFGKERFVNKKLQEVTLSDDAQAVLDKATEIVKKSFRYRKDFNQKHPEYHINTWDAGWYQIKGLCKEYKELKADLDEFNKLYKSFEDRMKPLVYELGFLYK